MMMRQMVRTRKIIWDNDDNGLPSGFRNDSLYTFGAGHDSDDEANYDDKAYYENDDAGVSTNDLHNFGIGGDFGERQVD